MQTYQYTKNFTLADDTKGISSLKDKKLSQIVTVFHIGHWHELTGMGLEKDPDAGTHGGIDTVSFSQYQVARTILANPNAMILEEGTTKIRYAKAEPYFESIFPSGFPVKYEELSVDQKEALETYRAPAILLGLNLVKYIYPTQSIEDYNRLSQYWEETFMPKLIKIMEERQDYAIQYCIADDELQKSMRKPRDDEEHSKYFNEILEKDEVLMLDRERITIEYIKSAVKSIKFDQTILLIFGALHRFEERIKESKHSNIIYGGYIPTSKSKDLEPIIRTEKIYEAETFSLLLKSQNQSPKLKKYIN